MDKEKRSKIIGYIICFAVEALIVFLIIWSKGFFSFNKAKNLQILADAFFVSGILMTLFAGMLYIGSEGAFIGVGFVLRNVVLAFIPLGRLKHEKYADYRARKLGSAKKSDNRCIWVTGLSFLAVGVIFTAIWYFKYFK